MMLRLYRQFLRRRGWLIALPALVVAVIGVATYQPPGAFYTVGVRFLVGPAPTDAADEADEQRLAAWQNSEYVVAAIADWVEGTRFSERISERAAEAGVMVPPAAIWKGGGGVAADYSRSMLTLSLNHGDGDDLAVLMDAAIAVVLEENDAGIPQLGGRPAEIVLLDEPIVNRIAPPIWQQLDLPVRAAFALAVGLALALLVESLDNTVRERRELEALGFTVLAEIPRPRGRWGPFTRRQSTTNTGQIDGT